MIRHPTRIRPLHGNQIQHRQQEASNLLRVLGGKVVFFLEYVGEGPVAQTVDIAQLALAVEDFLGPFAVGREGLGEGTEQLDDLSDVVVVFAIFGAGLGVEEVVAGYEFEDLWEDLAEVPLGRLHRGLGVGTHHCSHAPDVGTSAPFGSEDDFWGSVLSGLNVIGEVVAHPAGIAQISNLHRYGLE
jgi:hypothetical protein